MPSIRQLAQLAGVSAATVSLALHNDPRISKDTRRRIQQLAKQYHYKIPRPRQQFNDRYCGTIGCALSTMSGNHHQALVLEEIETRAFADSYRIAVLLHHGKIRETCLAMETFIEQGVDGLLVNTEALEPIPSDIFLEAASHDIPVVCFNTTPTARPQDLVTIDYAQGGMCTVEYLYELGHRHIAFLGHGGSSPPDQGIMQAARCFGMQCTLLPWVLEKTVEQIARIYQQASPPTAICCVDDQRALFVYQFAHRYGLQIPRDISIVGFGDILGELCCNPRLTTLDPLARDVGRRTYELLRRRMRQVPAGEHPAPEAFLVPPQLIIRESCAPPPRLPLRLHPRAMTGPTAGDAPVVAQMPSRRGKRASPPILWRQEDTVEALETLYQAETNTELRPRWQALWLLRQGWSRAEVANTVGVQTQTVRRWLAWYREGSLGTIAARRIGGSPQQHRYLTDEQYAELATQIRLGVLRTIREVCAWVVQRYQIHYSYWGMRKLLSRLR
ncbi:MAG TPA: substrate-binding domain-containing protein [Armatimonadota bacterium]|jgi:LacI family transcriptional regulator